MSIRDIAEPVSLNDGTVMPGYGFGCYAAHSEEIINAIRWAVRDGYRYIDSAAMYGNEAEVGEAIRTCGVQREELFISSKIWPTRFDDPDASLAQSLRDLGIDALDCCLLHWPGTDRKQRLSAYEKLLRRREEGFVRRIGVSNFQIKHLEEIRSAFGSFPVLNQIELHPLYQERDLCASCRENGIRLVLFTAPLPSGYLYNTDNYQSYVDALNTFCAARDGLVYWDFSLWRDWDTLHLTVGDYSDAHHLNGAGADKFTAVLCDTIRRDAAGENVADLFYDTVEDKLTLTPDESILMKDVH